MTADSYAVILVFEEAVRWGLVWEEMLESGF